MKAILLCRQEDNTGLVNKAEKAVEVCGARQRAQIRVEGVETVPSATSIVQLLAASTLGPEIIERFAESLPLVHSKKYWVVSTQLWVKYGLTQFLG